MACPRERLLPAPADSCHVGCLVMEKSPESGFAWHVSSWFQILTGGSVNRQTSHMWVKQNKSADVWGGIFSQSL